MAHHLKEDQKEDFKQKHQVQLRKKIFKFRYHPDKKFTNKEYTFGKERRKLKLP